MRTTDRVIVRAYVDTKALDIKCPECEAAPGHWCCQPDGLDRRVPCIRRALARTAEQETR